MVSFKNIDSLDLENKSKNLEQKEIHKYKLKSSFNEKTIDKKIKKNISVKRLNLLSISLKNKILYYYYKTIGKKEGFIFKKHNYLINFLILELILLLIPVALSEDTSSDSSNITEIKSELTFTMNGNGNQQVLSDDFSDIPILVFVNEEEVNMQNKIIENLTLEKNNVTMKWDHELIDCSNMFKGLNNIINVDFSHFNFSFVENISMIFYDCQNLKEINFNVNIIEIKSELTFTFNVNWNQQVLIDDFNDITILVFVNEEEVNM